MEKNGTQVQAIFLTEAFINGQKTKQVHYRRHKPHYPLNKSDKSIC